MKAMSFKKWEEANKDKVLASKKRIDEKKKQQMRIGEVVEKNFLACAMGISGEHVVVTKTQKTMDYMYGADFKLQYKDTGYSVYCDITVNPNKEFLVMHHENVFTMSNGCSVSIGYKKECAQFVYRKPVLVFVLHANYQAIEFDENDMYTLFFAAIQTTKYLSDVLKFEFEDKIITGGKRASQNIIFKHEKRV